MGEHTWTMTREQLVDALASLEVRVQRTGPAAGMVDADAMADAILDQIPEAAESIIAGQERDRSEALIIQAQDYAHAESERADKLAALALKAMNQCHALERDDSAPYLDEWSMALDQLESAAGEMSPPDSDPLEDAYQAGLAEARSRLTAVLTPAKFRLLADWFDADDALKREQFPTLDRGQSDDVQRDLRRFADLLEQA